MSNYTYNTSQEQLLLPKYGRMVQTMIERACTIEDKQQRQAYAENIIHVMDLLNPQMRRTPKYKQILWNHLAYMSNYQLDIDYPCEIEKTSEELRPHKLSYPGHKIHFRHYGYLLEDALKKLENIAPDAEYRESYICMVAARMKHDLIERKGEEIENDKIGRDIELYTQGKVTADEVLNILQQHTPQRGYSYSGHYARRGRR